MATKMPADLVPGDRMLATDMLARDGTSVVDHIQDQGVVVLIWADGQREPMVAPAHVPVLMA